MYQGTFSTLVMRAAVFFFFGVLIVMLVVCGWFAVAYSVPGMSNCLGTRNSKGVVSIVVAPAKSRKSRSRMNSRRG